MASRDILEHPTRFVSQQAAAKAAETVPLAGAVYISPATSKVEGVKPGWYVGFPRSVTGRLVSFEGIAPPEKADAP